MGVLWNIAVTYEGGWKSEIQGKNVNSVADFLLEVERLMKEDDCFELKLSKQPTARKYPKR